MLDNIKLQNKLSDKLLIAGGFNLPLATKSTTASSKFQTTNIDENIKKLMSFMQTHRFVDIVSYSGYEDNLARLRTYNNDYKKWPSPENLEKLKQAAIEAYRFSLDKSGQDPLR